MKLRWGNSPWAVWLIEAYLLADHLEEAARLATRNLEICRDYKERGQEAWILRLLGEIASGPKHLVVDAADNHYREALFLANELGMRPLVAHCHLGLGRLDGRTGKHARAEEHLITATTMYREMDMTYWLEKSEAELRAVTVIHRPILGERARQRAATLSGGEQQMLAIARALMARPRLLLLDVPSLGLAPLVVRDIFRVIREINAAGVGILLVEQDARLALRVAARGYVLETGRIVVHGPSTTLAGDPRIRQAYLGLGETPA